MRRFSLIVCVLTIGFVLVWGVVNFHVFRTPSGFVISVKRNPTLADTFVDVRGWGLVQWSEFPDLAWSLARSRHAHVVQKQPSYATAQKIEVDISR
jgi:hypothetical protein